MWPIQNCVHNEFNKYTCTNTILIQNANKHDLTDWLSSYKTPGERNKLKKKSIFGQLVFIFISSIIVIWCVYAQGLLLGSVVVVGRSGAHASYGVLAQSAGEEEVVDHGEI